jgi:hypothetical protein
MSAFAFGLGFKREHLGGWSQRKFSLNFQNIYCLCPNNFEFMVMPKGLFSFPQFCDLDKVAIDNNLTYDSANIDKKSFEY